MKFFLSVLACYIFLLFPVTKGTCQSTNDSCTNAILITALDGSCIEYPLDSLSFDVMRPNCILSLWRPNLWFTFIAQGPNVSINIDRPDLTLDLIRFDQPCVLTNSTVIACSTDGSISLSTLDVGQRYYIMITTDIEDSGQVNLCVNNPVPPANDLPCEAIPIEQEGCISGTTIDAGSSREIDYCGNNVYSNSVYYNVTLKDNTSRLRIALDSIDSIENISVAILYIPDSCSGYQFLAGVNSYYCGPVIDTITFDNMPRGQRVYIRIATSSDDAGTFSLCIHEIAGVSACSTNSNCANATPIIFSGQDYKACVIGCNIGMPNGPHFNGGGTCSYLNSPTSWFTFTTDNRGLASFNIRSEELTDPTFVLMSDCNTQLACEPLSADLNPNSTYYIAVTDANGKTGEFQICVTLIEKVDYCVTDQSLAVTGTSLGSPLEGPYKPCEEVEVTYSTNFIKLGAQWIHSIIPMISDCFDYVQGSEPHPAVLPQGNTTWTWYPPNTVTWKPIDNVDNLIGINAHTGKLCMIGTPDCISLTGGGNCSESGTPMPGGWIGTSFSGTCSSFDPNLSWGDNAPGPFNVTFTVKIPCTACEDTACLDNYNISVTAFSDGQTGGWQSSACNGNALMMLKLPIKCCSPENTPTIIPADRDTVCSYELVNKNFAVMPTNSTYRWTVAEANGVIGAEKGNGDTFTAQLINRTDTIQTVHYWVFAQNGLSCLSKSVDYFVSVRPAIKVSAGMDTTICSGQTIILGGDSVGIGGDGLPYTYQWSTGDTTNSITVTPTENMNYSITVTDSQGCTAENEVNVRIAPAIEANFEKINVDSINCSYQVFVIGGDGPFSYSWSNGMIGSEVDSLPGGMFSVTITDRYGCSKVLQGNCHTLSSQLHLFPGLSYWPNPTQGEIHFDPKSIELTHFNISVFNVLGIKSNSFTRMKDGNSIDLSHLPAGVYTIILSGDHGEQYFVKLIKME